MNTEQTLDFETMKTLAELSAKTAAESVAASLREEIRREFEHFEKRITDKIEGEFKAHFGSLSASEHIIQHSKLDGFLKWAEDMKKSAWQNIVGLIFKWGVPVAMALYIAYDKFGVGR